MPDHNPIDVLLVEDNPGDAGLVEFALEPYDFVRLHRAGRLAEAIAWLAANHCDVLLLDLTLPDSSGFSTIEKMQAVAPTLPLVVLTGFDDPDFALSAVAAGAQDYLVKGQTDGELLQRTIRYAISRKHLEERVRSSEERLQGILRMAHDAIIVVNREYQITLFNPAAERMFGYAAADILCHSLSELIPEPAREAHEQAVAIFAANPDQSRPMSDRLEISGRRRDGSTFPAEVSISKYTHHGKMQLTAVVRDITDRKMIEDELRRLATTDPLTGLANRRRFIEAAEAEIRRSRRQGGQVSLLMLDIDHFKRINDTHGHATGDEALKWLADTVRSALRDIDVPARLGGEEFAVLLPQTDKEQAMLVAERLRRMISAYPAPTSQGPVKVTVSIGVSTAQPDGDSIDPLLGRADAGLYAAKGAGRDCCTDGDAVTEAGCDGDNPALLDAAI